MGGFNFFLHLADPLLLFPQKFFPLGTLPIPAHKRIQNKDLHKVDHKQEGPERYGPEIPVMCVTVF